MSKKNFLIAVTIPLLILLGMMTTPLLTLFFGEEILLETRPVDPRDIFRGDYVRLNYKIEEVPFAKFPLELRRLAEKPEDSNINLPYTKKNTPIYGVLEKVNTYWQLDYITLEKPTNKIYINGTLPSFHVFTFRDKKNNNPIFVDFGLDRYFVPENTGKQLEEASRKGMILAKAKVLNGYAILTGIEIE